MAAKLSGITMLNLPSLWLRQLTQNSVLLANIYQQNTQTTLNILREYLIFVCVNVALSLHVQNGLPFSSQCLPASSFLQQADREHLCYSEVKETGDDQEDDGGGK